MPDSSTSVDVSPFFAQRRREMEYGGYTYILTNQRHTVLYVGVATTLERRLEQHRLATVKGFTSKYQLKKLVYYERYDRIEDAITREKQVKSKTRVKEEALIATMNPECRDLG